jgi:hypothetical protein
MSASTTHAEWWCEMGTPSKASGKEAQTREAVKFLQAADKKSGEKESLVVFVDRKLREEKRGR